MLQAVVSKSPTSLAYKLVSTLIIVVFSSITVNFHLLDFLVALLCTMMYIWCYQLQNETRTFCVLLQNSIGFIA